MQAIGIIGTIAGTGMQLIGGMQQSSYQSAAARNEAILQTQRANEQAAIGERQAITQQRKTDLVTSHERALSAASGTDAASPSTVDIEGQIAQQGGYNAMTALYEGLSKAQTSTYQSQLDLFKAQQLDAGAPMTAFGTLFGGLSKLGESKSFLKMFGD